MPQCSVGCGFCCSKHSWITVSELIKRYPKQAVLPAGCRVDCPALLDDGCGLPRHNRPDTCRKFLCDLAEAVHDKKVSLAWVWKYLDEFDNDPVKVLAALSGKAPIGIMLRQNARIQTEWEEEQLRKKTERRYLAC